MQITPITPMSPYFKGFKNLEKQQAEKDQYDREQIEIYKKIKKKHIVLLRMQPHLFYRFV